MSELKVLKINLHIEKICNLYNKLNTSISIPIFDSLDLQSCSITFLLEEIKKEETELNQLLQKN